MTTYAVNAAAINPSLVKANPRNIVKTPEKQYVSSGSQKVRLTPRGRLVTRLAVITSLSILLLSGFAALTGASAGPSESAVSTPYIKISVKPGETLWSIADSINSSGDLRGMVADILEINNLKSPELQAGQKIYIPTRP